MVRVRFQNAVYHCSERRFVLSLVLGVYFVGGVVGGI